MEMNRPILIIDTETAGGIGFPLPYDFSYIITNPSTDEIFISRAFVVREIWENDDLMDSAYYARKRPNYERNIQDGTRKVLSWAHICKILREDMASANCTMVGAYNMKFDKRAVDNDAKYITRGKFRFAFPLDTEFICIWRMACTSILRSKWFFKWAEKNEAYTACGNLSTSAETAYRFITKQTDFSEEHMGIEDVGIELQILQKILRSRMKYETEPNTACWRISQKYYKEWKGE